MNLVPSRVQFCLPAWVHKFLSDSDLIIPDINQRMRLAIELSKRNLEAGTGGPFGAAIFDSEEHRLLAIGVNLVASSNCSIPHAEMMALALAQQHLGHYTFRACEGKKIELVTSTEPCAMCLGAIVWSGIHSLVCGARDKDAREIGFDEGPKPRNWVSSLNSRKIAVVRDVCREEAVSVLNHYGDTNGILYNGV